MTDLLADHGDADRIGIDAGGVQATVPTTLDVDGLDVRTNGSGPQAPPATVTVDWVYVRTDGTVTLEADAAGGLLSVDVAVADGAVDAVWVHDGVRVDDAYDVLVWVRGLGTVGLDLREARGLAHRTLLTESEAQVHLLRESGLTHREIGEALGLQTGTIDSWVSRIREKIETAETDIERGEATLAALGDSYET